MPRRGPLLSRYRAAVSLVLLAMARFTGTAAAQDLTIGAANPEGSVDPHITTPPRTSP